MFIFLPRITLHITVDVRIIISELQSDYLRITYERNGSQNLKWKSFFFSINLSLNHQFDEYIFKILNRVDEQYEKIAVHVVRKY